MTSVTNVTWKPMGIGRMLDYSFQFYRRHFVKLFLLALAFYGPFYILQQLLLPDAMAGNSFILQSFLEGVRDGAGLDAGVFENRLLDYETDASVQIGKIVLFAIISILFVVAIIPIAIASVVIYVHRVLNGQGEPSIGDTIKQAFRRFWPLVGSNLLFGLILIAISIGAMIAIMAVTMTVTLVVGAAGFAGGSVGIGGGIFIAIMIFGAMLGLVILTAFFIIRLMYYLPLAALENESIGFGRSWGLTRKSFWRLFGTMFVMYLIIYIITIILSMLFGVVLLLVAPAWVSQAALMLVNTVLAPLMVVLYAVSYFDLRVRSEGFGLEAMIRQTVGTGTEQGEPVYGVLGSRAQTGYGQKVYGIQPDHAPSAAPSRQDEGAAQEELADTATKNTEAGLEPRQPKTAESQTEAGAADSAAGSESSEAQDNGGNKAGEAGAGPKKDEQG
ncbi:hypothetical protein [Paenibacillus sp. MBLB4367]|uniref:hypothetical protein n=1 Tax=Paenibacillus sp. MBLB4367 TaxID=3384767 RepID=UPI0039082FCB